MAISRPHPLQLISADEVTKASAIVRSIAEKQGVAIGTKSGLRFKNISLHDPPKALLLPYLDAEAAGVPAADRPFVPRLILAIWSYDRESRVVESVVSLDSGTEVAQSQTAKGQHGSIDRVEVRDSQQRMLEDPLVIEAIAKLNLPPGTIVQSDPWMYGADRNSNKDTHKFMQALLYARAPDNHPDSNQYAFPLPISPLYDIFEDKVVEITKLATGGQEDGLAYDTASDKPMAHCQANEYHPDLLPPARTDLKPLHVIQPEGPSFTITEENCVSWQKWRFRVGFNYREGMTVHDVRYDGRPVFYRLSVSEMTVPYGDPRSPFHRKQAFDLGDAGAGSTANCLSLGCDCLGSIAYFSGYLNDEEGAPVKAENVICLHEQDGGVGWKHTNFRTRNPSIARARNLILQTIITVGNYEYIFAWCFMQNGNVELETRATGILSTALIDPGKTSEWGNVVNPGVLAPNHQHLFSLRVDPMLDGARNSVFYEDSIAVPYSEEENPHGNAWRVVKTPFETSGFVDADPFANRVIKMVNETKRNPISGNPVGYKLVPQPCQLILAGENSVVRKRAKFAEHHVWVTKYRDGDLWAGGKWTNQSLSEVDGVFDYAARNEKVRNEDVVVWLTFGMTHNPRVEDFPVMPSEISTISLKPADFFDRNPALDVPQSRQEVNKSVLVSDPLPTASKMVGGGDECCDVKSKP
ncbi:copper amine oxidase 1 [Pseudomassariella vexata]|uniref:Amine oxidase n=1 Tax=Pseudomassariella vexata TaxID=1141098 RepID=A0A1Y2DLI9_9PEZI|nr:copper amine oxidase 1 [Pseudomassariella vexata]ORY59986.1 copper amine oxidase 1 [Pseudomassariella vexata]